MKKIIVLFAIVCGSSLSFAQSIRDRVIEDSLIGWQFPVPKGPYQPLTAKGRTLTPKQKEHMAKVMQWMTESYTPVASIGTFKMILNVSSNPAYTDYRQHSYWIDFRNWNVSFDQLDANKHFTPISEEYEMFPVRFNQVAGAGPIDYLSTGDNFLFTWAAQGYTENNSDAERLKNTDPDISATCAPFIVRNQSVILAPGNKLPFAAATIGDYLNAADATLDRNLAYAKANKDAQFNQENQQKVREEVYELLKTEFAGYRAHIAELRVKYKNQLNEPALLPQDNPSLTSQFYKGTDPFKIDDQSKKLHRYFEVYKVDKELMEKCKKDQPQYISFTLPYATKKKGNRSYELYTALTQNVNYQYIYDYFFAPEKIKGKTYTPADAAGLKKRLAAYTDKKAAVNNTSAPVRKLAANVLLDENFANTSLGKFPAGWWTRAPGKLSAVANRVNDGVKWLKLGANNKVMPTGLPKPLPDNFTLDFDVATDGGFTGYTGGGILLKLSTAPDFSPNGDEMLPPDRQTIELKLVSGNDANRVSGSNYRGVMEMEIHDSKGVNRENNKEGLFATYSLQEFTDKRNVVHVKLQMKNQQLLVSVNGKEVITPAELKLAYGKACEQCSLRKEPKFKMLYWSNFDYTGEGVGVYISNIRLMKE
jgi:hypothetical protein